MNRETNDSEEKNDDDQKNMRPALTIDGHDPDARSVDYTGDGLGG